MRKSRSGEVVCWCLAYGFPHRLTGGDCTGAEITENYFFGSDCRECIYLEDQDGFRKCQVIEGAEKVANCPAWQEEIAKNEVRLYGPKYRR